MTRSEQIKALRQSMGLSRDDFGGLYKVSKRTVEAWEQGLRTPSGFVLKDLEKRFKKLKQHA
jgi:DNA-binding transcriptional regulator YiaG